jgi:alpha-tubulin suppressor-like RCC1 family protein
MTSATDAGTPVDVIGLTSGVRAIAAGGGYTCALTIAGGVKCWGNNARGQLGNGTNINAPTPVDVSDLSSGVSAITVSRDNFGSHTCAVTNVGGVKCWGANYAGQLGNGTTTATSTPVDVSGLGSGVSAITAGGLHTCALTSAGGVKCWGANGLGELGNGTTDNSLTPIDVSGLSSGVSAIAAGQNHTCALTDVGGMKCWGWNGSGQLGNSTTNHTSTPVDVSGLRSDVRAIAIGDDHTCALITVGSMKCWGLNRSGQLGNGTTINASTPRDVSGLSSDVGAIAAGHEHTCNLTSAGGVKCWGSNTFGQLGNGTTGNTSTPAAVSGLISNFTAIATSYFHTCALTSVGGVKCWGLNGAGQLGNGTRSTVSTPADVSGLSSGVIALDAGYYQTCALTSVGGVKCWGYNYSGLGNGTSVEALTPIDVSDLSSGVSAIAVGGDYIGSHTCAVTSVGGVKCWGANARGQLGNGTRVEASTPVDVIGLTSGISAIAAGGFHNCALTIVGGVKCWGFNNNGQLGNGTTVDALSAVDVSGLNNGVTAIAAGYLHTCALTNIGSVKCWGWNYSGQLGNGSTSSVSTPVDVSGLGSDIIAIAAGYEHTCALTNAGGVQCWGSNSSGELGNGSIATAYTPVDVNGLSIDECRWGQVLGIQQIWPTGQRRSLEGDATGCDRLLSAAPATTHRRRLRER